MFFLPSNDTQSPAPLRRPSSSPCRTTAPTRTATLTMGALSHCPRPRLAVASTQADTLPPSAARYEQNMDDMHEVRTSPPGWVGARVRGRVGG